jgi:CRP-like cAMP-binding protein
LVNHLAAGQYFGEIGLLQGTERVATVRALTPTEVICLDREHFAELIATSDVSRAEMERLISQRINQLRAVQHP